MVSEFFMSRCLQLAEKGFGRVSPNPMVGAVIVYEDEIIGEGYHQQYGGPHAEVNAIASVKDPSLLPKSTIYVSLEPCCHYGKTPPCVDLILEKKIPHVVVCNRDPFPAVDGKGIEKLRAAGVEVEVGVKEEEGRWVNRRFFTYHEQHRPYIFLKWAQTADGFVDKIRFNSDEEPLHISNEESLKAMHQFRAGETAIMVGPNTAMLDNPSLTVRYAEGKQPIRILLDRDLKVTRDRKIYDGSVPTLVLTKDVPSDNLPNVKFLQCGFHNDGSLDIDSFYKVLYDNKIESLIVEGGTLLIDSLIAKNAWDELRVEINRSLYIGKGVEAPKVDVEKMELQKYQIQQFGDNEVMMFRKASIGYSACGE